MNDSFEPQLFQSELSPDEVEALFADLKLGAEVTHVQVKMASGMGAADSKMTLTDAHELLRLGQVAAIQIRYRYEQQDWCDTLMVLPHAVRIVRTKASVSS